jgi:glycosyltransferase involved in cell wall biosynthesis
MWIEMKILIVAMSNSIHTARWIGQIADEGWDLHLFPSQDFGATHPELRNVVTHHSFYGDQGEIDRSVRVRGIPVASRMLAYGFRLMLGRGLPGYRQAQLSRLIRRLRPDVVHSLEFQSAGYLTLESKRRLGGRFPKWIATNWGSDISLFGRLPEHQPRIRQILEECDFYSCECERDVAVARSHGLRGKALPVSPNSGGIDLALARELRATGPAAARRIIMLKGYQGWAGRALVGLRALARCARELAGYAIHIYAPSEEVKLAAGLFSADTGVPTVVVPHGTAHREILALHGRARISIGLSIGDAISTSLLEALAMGSFPIQSDTSCANEWISDGRTGLIVPPEDPDAVEAALRRALYDDQLVNRAAEENWATAEARLDCRRLAPKAVAMYRHVTVT